MTIKKKKVAPKKKKKIGPPYKIIDQKQFEEMCLVQCTQKEISRFIGVTDKTLRSWCRRIYNMTYSEVFAEKRVGGIVSLRRMGWKHAINNWQAWKFYAENFLGMQNNINMDVTQEPRKTLKITFVDNDGEKVE